MLRLALRPKWLALLAFALLVATVFAFLGNWQLKRSRQNATPVTIGAAKPISEVIKPQQGLPAAAATTPVMVDGVLHSEQVVVVDGRRDKGSPVRWLVAPVYLSQPNSTGADARLPVVLGAVPETGQIPTLPAGQNVHFTAMLQPSEEPAAATADGDTGAVSSADLVSRWGNPIYAGFVFADTATARSLQLTPIEAPKPQTDTGYAVLNLSYALQWWLFAAVACFLWWRVLRDAYRDEQEHAHEHVEEPTETQPDRSPTT